jgi:hypothetical protein
LARRNLLQARAIITVIVSAMIALIIQLAIDLYLSYKHVKLLHIAWPISFVGTLICAGSFLIYYVKIQAHHVTINSYSVSYNLAILYFVPSGRITISQAAKVGIYFFLSISAYTSCTGNIFNF